MSTRIRTLVGPTRLPNAAALAYTNTTNGPVIVKSIPVVNTTAGAITVTINKLINSATVANAAAANQIASGVSIPAAGAAGNPVNVLPAYEVLGPGDSLIWIASAAASLNAQILGAEIDPNQQEQALIQL